MTSLHILDTAVVGITAVATIATSTILGSDVAADAAQLAELKLFLLPFIGSLIISGGFIMLNPETETRRITIGRSIFALFIGVLMPQLVGSVHPALAGVTSNPALLMLVGGGISGLAYVVSKPFVSGLYKRSGGIAARGLDRLEERYSPKPKE